jgi:hypothetical protein
MENEKDTAQKSRSVKYYGKKAYSIKAITIRMRSETKVPICHYEDVRMKNQIKPSPTIK